MPRARTVAVPQLNPEPWAHRFHVRARKHHQVRIRFRVIPEIEPRKAAQLAFVRLQLWARDFQIELESRTRQRREQPRESGRQNSQGVRPGVWESLHH